MRFILFFFLSVQCFSLQAHDWSEYELPPDVLLERLVEIMEAARDDRVFFSRPSDGCIPGECLEQILTAATIEDLDWLSSSPDAELPSETMGRTPAAVAYQMLFDLVPLLTSSERTPSQAELADRLIIALEGWGR